MPEDDTYTHACTDTLARMRDKVAEHKDPDYLLAKAAFTVLRTLFPPFGSAAYFRAIKYLQSVTSRHAYGNANNDTWNLTPRRRWQDKKQ